MSSKLIIPQLGEIALGSQIGKKDTRGYYIWAVCQHCGKERWVGYKHGKPRSLFCSVCGNTVGNKHLSGECHPSWKGGVTKQGGYIVIYQPWHPYADCNGYIKRARLVLEEKLGRYLLPTEDSHHKGDKYPMGSIENKQDDRSENLEALSHSEHMRFHSIERIKNANN